MYDEDRLTSAELAREQAFALAQSASRTATMRSRVPPRVAHAFDLFDEPRRGILELRRLPAALEALDMSHSEPAVARELARYAGLSPLRPLDGLRSLRCSPRRLPFPTGTLAFRRYVPSTWASLPSWFRASRAPCCAARQASRASCHPLSYLESLRRQPRCRWWWPRGPSCRRRRCCSRWLACSLPGRVGTRQRLPRLRWFPRALAEASSRARTFFLRPSARSCEQKLCPSAGGRAPAYE